MKKILIIVSALLLSVILITYFIVNNSFEYAFYKYDQSFKNRDVNAFLSYYDFDKIVDNYFYEEETEILRGQAQLKKNIGEKYLTELKQKTSAELKRNFTENFISTVENETLTKKHITFKDVCMSKLFDKPLINKDTVIKNRAKTITDVYNCNATHTDCTKIRFTKIKNKWIVEEMPQRTNLKEEK